MVTFVKFTVLQKQELEHNAKLSDHFTEIRHTKGIKIYIPQPGQNTPVETDIKAS